MRADILPIAAGRLSEWKNGTRNFSLFAVAVRKSRMNSGRSTCSAILRAHGRHRNLEENFTSSGENHLKLTGDIASNRSKPESHTTSTATSSENFYPISGHEKFRKKRKRQWDRRLHDKAHAQLLRLPSAIREHRRWLLYRVAVSRGTMNPLTSPSPFPVFFGSKSLSVSEKTSQKRIKPTQLGFKHSSPWAPTFSCSNLSIFTGIAGT